MGLVAGLVLTGMLAYFAFALIWLPEKRREIMTEWQAAPVSTSAVFVWALCFIVFLWGIIVPGFGRISVHVGGVVLPLWQVGGLSVLVGGVIGIVWDTIQRGRR